MLLQIYEITFWQNIDGCFFEIIIFLMRKMKPTLQMDTLQMVENTIFL